MMGKTHALSAAALWLAGCATVTATMGPISPEVILIGTPVAVLTSYSPDLDHPSSKAARSLGLPTRLLSRGIAALSAAVYRSTSTPEDRPNGNGHRAITHTGLFCVVLGGIVAGVFALAGMAAWAWVGIPAGAGALFHLLGDACTKYGVPLVWPLKVKGRRWYSVGLPRAIRIRTDRAAERYLVIPLLFGMAGVAGYVLATTV
jgi:membrane-bound metal-dependent hydrolase YbcI (DUF457 family)